MTKPIMWLWAQRRLRSADAQADLSLRWAPTHFVGFLMTQLIFPRRNLKGERVIRHVKLVKDPKDAVMTDVSEPVDSDDDEPEEGTGMYS